MSKEEFRYFLSILTTEVSFLKKKKILKHGFYSVILLLRNFQHFTMAYRVIIHNYMTKELNRIFRSSSPPPSLQIR